MKQYLSWLVSDHDKENQNTYHVDKAWGVLLIESESFTLFVYMELYH